MSNSAVNFPAASARQKRNAVLIEFPTATGSWGTLINFFIAGAASGGNILGYGALPSPANVSVGDKAEFPPNSLIITLL